MSWSTRKPPEVPERRIAGAEIVDREPHATVVESMQHAQTILRRGGQEQPLGDLELEIGRLDAARLQDLGDQDVELAAPALDRGHVDRDDGRAQAGLAPDADLPAGGMQHPGAQRHDEPALLGPGHELAGQHGAASGAAPAKQGLDADQATVRHRHLGLVVEVELAELEPKAEVTLEQLALLHRGGEFRCVEAERAAPFVLGPIER